MDEFGPTSEGKRNLTICTIKLSHDQQLTLLKLAGFGAAQGKDDCVLVWSARRGDAKVVFKGQEARCQ